MKKILAILLVALMLVGMLPMAAISASAAETTDVEMSVLGTTGVLAGDKLSISWASDNVTFTNYKASSTTAIRNSDSAHYRVYAKSEVEISAPGNITKVVITSAGSSYNTPWVNSAGAIGTATLSGSEITLVPTTPAATIKFAATAQVRLSKLVVTYEVAGGDAACEHTNTQAVEATPASCEAPGFTAGTYCNDCESYIDGHEVIAATGHAYGDWIDVTAATCTEAGEQKAICANCGAEKTQTVAALGHNYVDGICTGCGHVAVITNYELVTDAASLKAGDQLILVGANADGAYSVMIPYASGNNLKAESINAPVDGKIELADTSAAAIITLGGDNAGWTFFDGTYYLYSAGTTKSNYLKGTTSLKDDNTTAWTIAIDENGLATIINVGNTGEGARNVIKFNYGNSPVLFANYASTYVTNVALVSIYRLSDGTTEEPEVTEPEVTEPEVTEPEVTEPEVTECAHSYVNNVCIHCGAEFEGEIDTPDPTEPEVTEPAAEVKVTFELGDNGSATHVDGKTAKTTYSETVNGYTLNITGGNKMYPDSIDAKGNGCIKLGTGSAVGGFTFTVPTNVNQVIICAAKYKANTTKLDVNGTTYTLEGASNDGAYDEIIVDTSSNKTVTVTTVSGGVRAMVNSITFVVAGKADHECQWDEGTVTTAATCTTDGVMTYSCTVDGCTITKTEVIKATGHNFTYVDGAMTCACGESVTINTIADAKAYTSTSQIYYIEGVVTYVSGKTVYIEDATGGICVYFATADDAAGIAVGDKIVVWDTMTKYNGLIETTNTTALEYMKVSSGNELPSQTVTIADLLADTTNEYLAERVVIENVTIGVLGTNNTALTDASGNTINIYKAPALNAEINENDTVTVTAIVSSYNAYQLLVNSAADVVETAAGEEEVIETVTIATAKAGAEGDYFQVEGVVTYIAGRNVYVQDETGAIVVYLTANAATVKVGDKVKAYGALKSYYGLLELDAVDETNVKFFEILSNDNTVDAQALTIEALNADLTNEYLAEKITLENVYISYFSYNSTRNDVTYTLIDANGNTIKINRVAVTAEADCYAAGSLVNLEAYVSKYVNDSTEGNGYQLVTDNAKITVLSVCNHETTELVNFVQASCGVAGYTGDVQCTVCKYYVSRGEDVAALEHDFQGVVTDPTCTERGYTTYACIHCGEVDEVTDYVDALGHSYADGICGICGAADPDYVACEHNYIAEITYATTTAGGYTTYTCEHCGDSYQDNFTNKLPMNLRFASAYLALESDLSVIFQVKSEVLAAYKDVRLVFTLGDSERVMEMTEEEYFLGQYGRPSFKFTGVAPRHANTTIYATLYGTIEGVEHTYTMQYSATKYCYSTLRQAATTAPLKTLIVDLLNYGAAHQVYGNTNLENLATSDLTDAEKALGTSTVPAMTSYLSVKYVTHEAPTARFRNAALYLNDAVIIRCKLNLNAGIDINNVTVKVTDDEGNEWIVNGSELEPTGEDYYLNFNALSAQQMRKIVYLTICENGEAISHTLRYSIESYAAANYKGNGTALDNVVLAMMRYGDSAKAYFESK